MPGGWCNGSSGGSNNYRSDSIPRMVRLRVFYRALIIHDLWTFPRLSQWGGRASDLGNSALPEIPTRHPELDRLAEGGIAEPAQQRREIGESVGDDMDHLAFRSEERRV